MKKLNVAIVGATGAVGQELLKVMDEHNFPYAGLKLLATKNSAGKIINFLRRRRSGAFRRRSCQP